jgi:translocation and assembly module TamB
MTFARRRSRARRVLGVIGAVVGTTVTFVTATAAAAVLHLDTAAARRLVATQVSNVASSSLAGDVVVEGIGSIALFPVARLEGVRVRVRDADGVQVLFADGVSARVQSTALLRGALFSDGPIPVHVDAASIDHVHANLDANPAGELRLATAFQPATPEEPKPEEPPGRGVLVEAPHLRLEHAWISGTPPGAPLVDAELHELAARAHVDPDATRAALERVRLVTRGLPMGADPRGTLSARVSMPSETGEEMGLSGVFDGAVANVTTTLEAQMDGDRVDGRLEMHDDGGDDVSAVLGEGITLRDDLTVEAKVHGVLPRIEGNLKAKLGRATAAASATVVTGDTTQVDATLGVRGVDLSRVARGAPASHLGLDAQARLAVGPEGRMDGGFELRTLPGRIEEDTVPRLDVRGELEGETVRAWAKVDDPRAKVDAALAVIPRGEDRVVEGDVRVIVPEIANLPGPAAGARGRAELRASGAFGVGTQSLDAHVALRATNVEHEDRSLGDARVDAQITGTVSRPRVRLGAHTARLRAGDIAVSAMDARADVTIGDEIVVRSAHVDAVRGNETLGVTASRIGVRGESVRVDGAVIEGFGAPIRADFRRDRGRLEAKIDAPRIEVERIGAVLGRPRDFRAGTVAMAGKIASSPGKTTADLRARADGLSVFDVNGAGLEIDANLADREASLAVRAKLAEAGDVVIRTSEVRLDGDPLEPRSWERASGVVHLDVDVDMAKLSTLVPVESLPASELGGRLSVHGTVGRREANGPPDVRLAARTRGLWFSPKTDLEEPIAGTEVLRAAPWRSDDVDFELDADIDAPTGQTALAARAIDGRGIVAAIDLKARFPYGAVLADPSTAMEHAKTAPFAVRAVVPSRRLDRMPRAIRQNNVSGTVDADLEIAGTALAPRVRLDAHGRGVRTGAMAEELASDTDVRLTYDGEAADLGVDVHNGGRRVLGVASHVTVRARDVLSPEPGKPLPWLASAKVKVEELPLALVNGLSDRDVRGRVNGEVALEGLNEDARLTARLGLDDLRVGRAQYSKARVEVTAGDRKLSAKARFEQSDGFAELSAASGLSWGAELAPTPDLSTPATARLVAKAFRAAAVAPFLPEAVNDLDGRIDADTTVRIGGNGLEPQLDGRIDFREGRVQLAALGDELRDVQATVVMERGGRIRVKDVQARSVGGRLFADATVDTDGLSLANATANLRIPESEKFDLALEGAPVGQIWGRAKLTAQTKSNGDLDVVVEVPTFQAEIPQNLKAGIQTLGENPNIRIGTYRRPDKFVLLPLDPDDLKPKGEVDVDVDSGDTVTNVDVRLGKITAAYGKMARVVFTGNPKLRVGAGDPEVRGQIELTSGTADLQGKKFEIERGTITFAGDDPSNPTIVATAHWTAEDDTEVFADFVGPVKSGKVTLRSEPPRPENEILALILFGTADGANPTPQPSQQQGPDATTKAAVGLGGGIATEGLTEALDDLAGIQAQARIDTTSSNNPRPEIEFQVAPRVSIQFSHVLGEPPITQPDKNFATLEWRVFRNWSLETTFGDRGSSMFDGVWQKRY